LPTETFSPTSGLSLPWDIYTVHYHFIYVLIPFSVPERLLFIARDQQMLNQPTETLSFLE